jgi:hypothetical protein
MTAIEAIAYAAACQAEHSLSTVALTEQVDLSCHPQSLQTACAVLRATVDAYLAATSFHHDLIRSEAGGVDGVMAAALCDHGRAMVNAAIAIVCRELAAVGSPTGRGESILRSCGVTL